MAKKKDDPLLAVLGCYYKEHSGTDLTKIGKLTRNGAILLILWGGAWMLVSGASGPVQRLMLSGAVAIALSVAALSYSFMMRRTREIPDDLLLAIADASDIPLGFKCYLGGFLSESGARPLRIESLFGLWREYGASELRKARQKMPGRQALIGLSKEPRKPLPANESRT